MIATATVEMVDPSYSPELFDTIRLSVPYPPPPLAIVLIPPMMMIDAADAIITSSSASIRNFVRSVSGRKAAKARHFHTQSHLPSASIGKSAVRVVMPQ